ncbi:hypothetical protein, partial [Mycobacterium avium]
MALLLQDIFDGFALGKSRARLDAVAAWVSLEDGDIAVGISRMSADLVAVNGQVEVPAGGRIKVPT